MERKRDKQLNIRCTERELDMLAALAEADGLSVSDWVRQSIRKAYKRAFPSERSEERRT